MVYTETQQNVRIKGNETNNPATIISYNIRREDNGRIDFYMMQDILNQINDDVYTNNPAVEINYQVAIREPVYATTHKIPARQGNINLANYIMFYYDEFDVLDPAANETYPSFIVRVYITDKSGQGDENEKSHCFYEALRNLHVFNTTPYKTYQIFLEKYNQLPKKVLYL